MKEVIEQALREMKDGDSARAIALLTVSASDDEIVKALERSYGKAMGSGGLEEKTVIVKDTALGENNYIVVGLLDMRDVALVGKRVEEEMAKLEASDDGNNWTIRELHEALAEDYDISFVEAVDMNI